MRRFTPPPVSAIVTGLGIIAFTLLYHFVGIFPSRARWSPGGRAVTHREEPAKFQRVVVVSLVLGGGVLAWGLARLRKG